MQEVIRRKVKKNDIRNIGVCGKAGGNKTG